MSKEDMNELVLWYLSKEGYKKSAKIFEKSIRTETKLSKEKIEKFENFVKQVKKDNQGGLQFGIYNNYYSINFIIAFDGLRLVVYES